MIIYRVEDSDGAGPYNGTRADRKRVCYEMRRAHLNKPHRWPSPISDSPRHWINSDELCGFQTLLDLATWFDSFLDRLLDAGFFVVAIRIPKRAVIPLGRQVVFKKRQVIERKVILVNKKAVRNTEIVDLLEREFNLDS